MTDRHTDRHSKGLLKQLGRWSVSKKVIAIIFIILFLVSLLPIIITSFYSVPILDDYNFGLRAHQSFADGNGFFAGAIDSCLYFYKNWQGFFTSNFIASSQLYSINENLYFVSNLLFFSVFIVSLFYISKVLLIDVLHISKIDYILVSIPIIELIIQFLPSAFEGIYWMNGSLVLLVSGFILFLISFVIRYDLLTKKSTQIILFILTILLSAICSGAIVMDCVTLLILFVWGLFYYVRQKKKSVVTLLIINFCILFVGLMISLLAPGNKVRAQSIQGFSLFNSIKCALVSSFELFGKWLGVSLIVILIFSSVVLWDSLKKSKLCFKNPLLVFIGCFAIYSGRMSVQYYAGGYLGAPRQMDQYYLGFVICISVAWIYFVGWLSKRVSIESIINTSRCSVVFCLFVVLLFSIGCFSYGLKNLVSVSTAVSLIKGETQQYHQEMSDRIVLYKSSENQKVEVIPLTVYPNCFGEETLTSDAAYWTNDAVAKYYKLNSVILLNKDDERSEN